MLVQFYVGGCTRVRWAQLCAGWLFKACIARLAKVRLAFCQWKADVQSLVSTPGFQRLSQAHCEWTRTWHKKGLLDMTRCEVSGYGKGIAAAPRKQMVFSCSYVIAKKSQTGDPHTRHCSLMNWQGSLLVCSPCRRRIASEMMVNGRVMEAMSLWTFLGNALKALICSFMQLCFVCKAPVVTNGRRKRIALNLPSSF